MTKEERVTGTIDQGGGVEERPISLAVLRQGAEAEGHLLLGPKRALGS